MFEKPRNIKRDLTEATRTYWSYSVLWNRGLSLEKTLEEVFHEINYVRYNLIKPTHRLFNLFDALTEDIVVNAADPPGWVNGEPPE